MKELHDHDLDEFVNLVGTNCEPQANESYYRRLHTIHPANVVWYYNELYSTKWSELSYKVYSSAPYGGWDELRIDKLKWLEEWFQKMTRISMT